MKSLLEKLQGNYSAYFKLHAGTAKMDLDIIQKRASGKSTIQTSMEIPCSEATIYRAINRVRHFLEEEVPLLQNTLPKEVWVHRAIELGKMQLSLTGYKLLVILRHRFKTWKTPWQEGLFMNTFLASIINVNEILF